jgi:hypothetical protein
VKGFQAYDEGSIPFTRSILFSDLPQSVLKVDTAPGCVVDTNSPLLFPARMRRRPFRRAWSALRTASISTGAYVLWSVFELPIELASLPANPTGPTSPAMASTTPERRISIKRRLSPGKARARTAAKSWSHGSRP